MIFLWFCSPEKKSEIIALSVIHFWCQIKKCARGKLKPVTENLGLNQINRKDETKFNENKKAATQIHTTIVWVRK